MPPKKSKRNNIILVYSTRAYHPTFNDKKVSHFTSFLRELGYELTLKRTLYLTIAP